MGLRRRLWEKVVGRKKTWRVDTIGMKRDGRVMRTEVESEGNLLRGDITVNKEALERQAILLQSFKQQQINIRAIV